MNVDDLQNLQAYLVRSYFADMFRGCLSIKKS